MWPCEACGLNIPYKMLKKKKDLRLTKSKHYCGICKKVWDLQIVEVGCTVMDGEECECMHREYPLLGILSLWRKRVEDHEEHWKKLLKGMSQGIIL
ncbi:hypothetical protein VIGAN_11131100 [Vigna angularis var. angularis]|uniref:Uncharacterized protein n=1 Tax=Vigna angularis var. angularis TaxID=157739 RepID=A0A0S3TAE4_PHAAN|nr:hypothetical protein VIGAN_11131100 [Vigna angularis var. angularis]